MVGDLRRDRAAHRGPAVGTVVAGMGTEDLGSAHFEPFCNAFSSPRQPALALFSQLRNFLRLRRLVRFGRHSRKLGKLPPRPYLSLFRH
jgi:hypothetical protein